MAADAAAQIEALGAATPASVEAYSQPKQAAINLHHTLHLYDALRKLDNPAATSGVSHVGVCHKGDSMGAIPRWIMQGLVEKHGLGGFVSPNLGFSLTGFAWSFSGGAWQANTVSYRGLPASYEHFSGANQIVMPDGSSATITIPRFKTLRSSSSLGELAMAVDSDADFSKQPHTLKFIYLKKPGGGELTFTVAQDRETYSPVVVDTDDTLELAHVDVEIKNLAGNIGISVDCANSESWFLGFVAYYDSGVIIWESSVGGTPMQLWANSYVGGELSQPDQDLFALLNTKGLVYLQRSADADNVATRYTEYLNATSVVEASHILLGEPPSTSAENSALISYNAILRAEAETRRWTYIDLLQLAGGDNVLADELGWTNPDPTHLSQGANRTLGSMVFGYLDGFHTVSGKSGFHALTPKRYDDLRIQSAALDVLGADVTFGSTNVANNPQITGSAAITYSDERGIQFDLNSGLSGSAAANLTPHMQTTGVALGNERRISLMVGFYRGVSIAANTRACLFFGSGFTPLKSPEDLTGLGWGLQIGDSAGESATGLAGDCIRLFYHDGTSLTYLPWAPCYAEGSGFGNTAHSVGMDWDRDTNRVRIWAGRGDSAIRPVYETRMPSDWGTKAIPGQWVSASLYDTGSAAAANSDFHIKKVIVRSSHVHSRMPEPFGLSI
jgi:hypothetical protein